MQNLFKFVIQSLDDQKSFITTCQAMYDWIHNRNKVDVLEQENNIILTFYENLNSISYKVIGKKKISKVHGGSPEYTKDFVKLTNVTIGLVVEIVLSDEEEFNE
jgi:hypothetical protein